MALALPPKIASRQVEVGNPPFLRTCLRKRRKQRSNTSENESREILTQSLIFDGIVRMRDT